MLTVAGHFVYIFFYFFFIDYNLSINLNFRRRFFVKKMFNYRPESGVFFSNILVKSNKNRTRSFVLGACIMKTRVASI